MPELPDVEVYRRRLEAGAVGRRVAAVAVRDARILAGLSAADLSAKVTGARIRAGRRHGKHLLVHVNGGWLTMHFGMTGSLEVVRDPADEPRFACVRFDLDDGGRLVYASRRKLGRIGWAADADAFIRAEGLGPDALDPALDRAAFAPLLAGRRGGVKAVLMDQSVIAGVGNIYSDEILFQARIHPKAGLESLDAAARDRLFAALREVLEIAVARGAGSEQYLDRLPAGFLLPERRRGGRCPRCGAELATIKISARTAYFCPRCQGEPEGG